MFLLISLQNYLRVVSNCGTGLTFFNIFPIKYLSVIENGYLCTYLIYIYNKTNPHENIGKI